MHVLHDPALTAVLAPSDGHLERANCLRVTGAWGTDPVAARSGSTVGPGSGGSADADGLPARWVEPLPYGVVSSLAAFDGIGLAEPAADTAAVARR